jgi:hypothetical protein
MEHDECPETSPDEMVYIFVKLSHMNILLFIDHVQLHVIFSQVYWQVLCSLSKFIY